MPTYRIGLVGTGGIAHRHMAAYREVLGERCEVTAACDLRDDVLADFCERYAVPHRFSTAQAMISSGTIDVVVALTPPAVRDEIIDPAIEHGVHLFVEKPFGEDAQRCVGYVKDAASAGCLIAVNQDRWFPEVESTYEVLRDGRLGTTRYVNHDHFQNRPQRPGVWRAAEKRLEMAIFSTHVIDRIQWLAQKNPLTVSAVTRRDPHGDLEGEQFSALLIQFEDGLVATMTSSWLSKSLSESRLRVDADEGSITVTRPHMLMGDARWSMCREGEDTVSKLFLDDGHFTRCFGRALGELLDGIDEDREPANSGRDNLKTMGIMDAAYLSAERGGEQVAVEEVLGASWSSLAAGA